jgi:hypothetical protein
LIYFLKATWFEARDWCTKRGMQMATLKTLSQMEAVTRELKNREFRENIGQHNEKNYIDGEKGNG